MIRYTAVGKTVRELKDRLQDLCDHGMGEDTIQAFDPDVLEWVEITGLTYGGGDFLVKIYSDVNEGEDEDDIVPTIRGADLMELEEDVEDEEPIYGWTLQGD